MLDGAAGLGYPQNQLSAVRMACLILGRQTELLGITNDAGEELCMYAAILRVVFKAFPKHLLPSWAFILSSELFEMQIKSMIHIQTV